MAAPSQAVITAAGMVSSVGQTLAQSCAAIRAGIARFREVPEAFFQADDPLASAPEPVIAAAALDDHSPGALRRLLLAALQDLLANAGLTRRSLASIPMTVSLPAADRSPRARAVHEELLRDCGRHAGVEWAAADAAGPGGHAGMLRAVADAVRSIAAGRSQACIVAGVDSYLDPETLSVLDASGRGKSARNRDGFIPGECASAVLLEERARAKQRGAVALATVDGLGAGREERPIASGEPPTGGGLGEAVRQALSGDPRPVDWMVCDENGESHRSKEWALARIRLGPALATIRHAWRPAASLGDVGAATGGVLMGVAARAFQRGYAPAERVLLWAASDHGERAALTLKKA